MKGKTEGYNADKDEYADLVAAGVIDPARVVRTALQNAASVASLLLTTDSLVTEVPTEEEEGGHDHHDHGMGGMGGGMGGSPNASVTAERTFAKDFGVRPLAKDETDPKPVPDRNEDESVLSR